MAARPWVSPEEVREYTSHEELKSRPDKKLSFDIARAEIKIVHRTNNHFADDAYPEIPEEVKMAVILLAEAYAKNDVESTKRQIKSETFDDYSYTAETAMIDIETLDLDDLLAAHVLATGRGTTVFKLRKL